MPAYYCARVADDFSTEVTQEENATIIYVRGEIDMATCERLRDAIEPHLGPQQAIVLDLSGVGFMDSSCLGMLLQARGTLTADGGSLVLRNPSLTARRLLSVAGVQHLLQIDAIVDPDDDENPSNTANPPGLRSEAEWDGLTNQEVNALGADVEPKSRSAKRTGPKG